MSSPTRGRRTGCRRHRFWLYSGSSCRTGGSTARRWRGMGPASVKKPDGASSWRRFGAMTTRMPPRLPSSIHIAKQWLLRSSRCAPNCAGSKRTMRRTLVDDNAGGRLPCPCDPASSMTDQAPTVWISPTGCDRPPPNAWSPGLPAQRCRRVCRSRDPSPACGAPAVRACAP
jgi:hypothetical protein